ncbi:MAG: hypothetical protein ACTS4Z_02050, partial [Candidatus Hodgkinia cicadicola]
MRLPSANMNVRRLLKIALESALLRTFYWPKRLITNKLPCLRPSHSKGNIMITTSSGGTISLPHRRHWWSLANAKRRLPEETAVLEV